MPKSARLRRKGDSLGRFLILRLVNVRQGHAKRASLSQVPHNALYGQWPRSPFSPRPAERALAATRQQHRAIERNHPLDYACYGQNVPPDVPWGAKTRERVATGT
jgi:hypothetical protein